MKRDIYNKLVAWKSSNLRKPLILRGARQSGKTYILKEFGQNEYRDVHYFNFEENPELAHFFDRDLDPKRILSDLSLYCKQTIKPGEDLIIFDEIQVSNKALNSLKYFCENANEYHITSAGSLLGIKLSSPGSFPVGKVNFLNIFPLTFFEFLDATGESEFRQLLERSTTFNSLETPFHEDLIRILCKYYFVGGMPEAVKHYAATANLQEVRQIQKEIIDSYILDFSKHAPTHDIPKLSLIWDSIPAQLSKDNKKFLFSSLKQGARAREYENALSWLDDTGLIHKVTAIEHSGFPLKQYAIKSCFKLYYLDIGLLGAMAKIPAEITIQGNHLFNEYKGAFVENYVAQQLTATMDQSMYYWRSKNAKAEVDFLCEINGQVYPLEVKAGVNPKSKSLRSYAEKFSPPRLARTTLLNFKENGDIRNIPLYAIFLLPKLISQG
ncbi:MAG: ATP-binding protein [Candidatus Omnitrophica bacterium]|nr:ATP-binding protein [Candidatus Omnitrophota bacterium]MBU1783838.1 ATP-binding protein [Candidatus Omnitrophota bacterium]MBU1851838.1 ATP-binding protein [Candidatus Omnitrophota bacterium]